MCRYCGSITRLDKYGERYAYCSLDHALEDGALDEEVDDEAM